MAGFGITTRGASQLLFRPGLDKNMLEGYTQYTPEWDQLIKAGTTDQIELARARIAGPNRMFQTFEGEPAPLQTLTVSNKFSAVDRTFQVGYGVTLEAREDDLYGKLDKGAMYIGNAARLTHEYQVGAFIDDLFAGTSFTGMDGLSLLNANHPLMNSSTLMSNVVATPVGFSEAGVNALLQLAANARDENGDPIKVKLDTLIIPNDVNIEQDAWRLFNQMNQVNTANRNDNAIKHMFSDVKIITSHFMTSTQNYFMFDSRLLDAHFLMRKPLQMRDWMDQPTQTQFVAARMRFMIYAYNWRGMYGANPT